MLKLLCPVAALHDSIVTTLTTYDPAMGTEMLYVTGPIKSFDHRSVFITSP